MFTVQRKKRINSKISFNYTDSAMNLINEQSILKQDLLELDKCKRSLTGLQRVDDYVTEILEGNGVLVTDVVNHGISSSMSIIGIESRSYYIDVSCGNESIFDSIGRGIEAIFTGILTLIEKIIESMGRFITAVIDFITGIFSDKSDKDENKASTKIETEIKKVKEAIKENVVNKDSLGVNFKSNNTAQVASIIDKLVNSIKKVPMLFLIEDCITEDKGFTNESLKMLITAIDESMTNLNNNKVRGYRDLSLMDYLLNRDKLSDIMTHRGIDNHNRVNIVDYVKFFYEHMKTPNTTIIDPLVNPNENDRPKDDISEFNFTLLLNEAKRYITIDNGQPQDSFKSELSFFKGNTDVCKLKPEVFDVVKAYIHDKMYAKTKDKSIKYLFNIMAVSEDKLYVAYVPQSSVILKELKEKVKAIEKYIPEYDKVAQEYVTLLNEFKGRNLTPKELSREISKISRNRFDKLAQEAHEIIILFLDILDIVLGKIAYTTEVIDVNQLFSSYLEEEHKKIKGEYLTKSSIVKDGVLERDVLPMMFAVRNKLLSIGTNAIAHKNLLDKAQDDNKDAMIVFSEEIMELKEAFKKDKTHSKTLGRLSGILTSYATLMSTNYTNIAKIFIEVTKVESRSNISDIVRLIAEMNTTRVI